MLCERCQEREAKVHAAILMWPAVEPEESHFCEECYPQVEAERLKKENAARQEPPPPMPLDIERVTAAIYLGAQERARRGLSYRTEFKKLNEALAKSPEMHQRIALGMITIILGWLERCRKPPRGAISFVVASWARVKPGVRPTYLHSLEKIARRCFELRNTDVYASAISTRFDLEVGFLLLTLRHMDSDRFKALFSELNRQVKTRKADPWRPLLDWVKERIDGDQQ